MKTAISFLGWISGFSLIKKGSSMVRDSFELLEELSEEERVALQRTVEQLATTPMYEGEPEWMMSFRASDESQTGEPQPLLFFIQASVGMGFITIGFGQVSFWVILIAVLLK